MCKFFYFPTAATNFYYYLPRGYLVAWVTTYNNEKKRLMNERSPSLVYKKRSVYDVFTYENYNRDRKLKFLTPGNSVKREFFS